MIDYYLITKPGIIAGNLVTLFAGFLLASRGDLDLYLLSASLLGLVFIVASACVFNNYIDRDLDKLMNRTKRRPIAQGKIGKREALTIAFIACFLGNVVLLSYTNLLTLMLADLGLFIYVCLYSMWKRDTIYGTAIGSLAGALPPVIGYTAAANRLDLAALLLFVMLVMWQMPHFFSIAIMHFDDYTQAKIPVVPVMKGIDRARIHMLLYIAGFILSCWLLVHFGYAGQWFLGASMAIGVAWLSLCLYGYKSVSLKMWGRHMFRHSLLMINAAALSILADRFFF